MEVERPKYLDPKQFYKDSLDSWESLWNHDDSLFGNTYDILTQTVFLPHRRLLSTIATIYILMPSKWSKIAPIMFCWGDKGSGKSTIAMFANIMHGFKQTFSPTDTFASIRNALDGMRWLSFEDKELEKEGALLSWDNIHIATLQADLKIYQLLLFGYNRATDKIRIAGSNGRNIDYFVYCPKIISSIEPLHLVQEFNELQRRLLIIPHKQWENFNNEEKQEYHSDLDIKTDRLELDGIHWEGIENQFYNFWNNPDNCQSYVGWRALLTKKGIKPFKIPDAINGSQWTISIDLIATGLTLGVFENLQHSIDFISCYWELMNNKIFNEPSASVGHVKAFIQEEAGMLIAINRELALNGMPLQDICISPQKLRDRLVYLQNRGELDITVRQKDINYLMWCEGWKLTTKGWVQR